MDPIEFVSTYLHLLGNNTPKTQKPKMPKTPMNLTLKRVSILYFTKEIPTAIFASSNHLVSVGIAVIKLNLTIFASVTIYLHLFQETRL